MVNNHKERNIVEPKDAATVILLRDRNAGGGGVEVLMVLRHPDNKFVANAYVYPGGALDEEDALPDMEPLCQGVTRDAAIRLMDDMPSEKALGAWIAGIRETFEEVGLLLAYDRRGELVTFNTTDKVDRFCAYRDELCRGTGRFREMIEREGIKLAADRLHYFSHWITPEPLPIRYDVRFFVAQAPPGQEALHDGCELIEHVWIAPQDALEENGHGRFGMVLPTIMTMREMCAYRSVEEIIRSTAGKKIPRILTKMARKGNSSVEIMPDGTVYGPSPV